MNSTSGLWVLIVVTLFCAGCVTSGTDHVTRGHELLASRTEVVASLSEVPCQDITFAAPVQFAFDENSCVLQMGESRRFAKLLALPVGRGSYSVHITSFMAGVRTDPAIMYPEVQLLDKDYSVVRTLPHTDFALRPSLSRDGLNAAFFINGNAQREHFLLITNRPMAEADLTVSQSNVTSSVPVTVVVPGGVATWMIPTGSNTAPVKMKASPIGELFISLQEYRPKKIGE